MGALRRPQFKQEDREDLALDREVADAPKTSYPRWAVLSGLVIYCAVFWGIAVVVGTWGVDLVRTAAAGPN